jgi:hypothetical protein
MTLRIPAAPGVLLARVAGLELVLAGVQLGHLALLAQAQVQDFAAWVFVHAAAQGTLFALRRAARHCRSYPSLPWRPLAVLIFITFTAKLSSRAPYIGAWMSEGLFAARNAEDAGAGGGASFINIFFYPLVILLSMCVLPRKTYLKLMLCVTAMCMIDFIVLGTRNAPLFVLMFHLLASPLRLNKKIAAVLLGLVFAFVAMFSYSTVNRTQESQLGTFDWLDLFELTGSTENLRIRREMAEPVAQAVPALLPAIFLTHYVSHSIAELAVLVGQSDDLRLGGAYYVTDQFCVIGMCSRQDSLDAIEAANPRAGTYQTIWGSLLFDFGFLGAGLAWFVVSAMLVIWQRMQRRVLSPAVLVGAMVIALAPIENYLYNGLGLVQILSMFIAYHAVHLLALARRRRARPPITAAVQPA